MNDVPDITPAEWRKRFRQHRHETLGRVRKMISGPKKVPVRPEACSLSKQLGLKGTRPHRWYFTSDGRKFYGTQTIAAALGVSQSAIRNAMNCRHRVGDVYIGLSPNDAKRSEAEAVERNAKHRTVAVTVYASDGRSWPSIGAAARSLGASFTRTWVAMSGRRKSLLNGVCLAASPSEARQRFDQVVNNSRGAA